MESQRWIIINILNLNLCLPEESHILHEGEHFLMDSHFNVLKKKTQKKNIDLKS